MTETSRIQVAIIGYGLSFHIFHVPFICSLPDQYILKAIVQRHPTDNNNAAQDYPQANVYTSTDDMLASEPEVELVVVSTIPSTHYDLCKTLLEAGKNIVCEKPLVATSEAARELAALAKQKDKILAVYQNRRWDSDFLMLRQVLDKELLGRVVDVQSHFDRHRPEAPASAADTSWKAKDLPGNGAIYDLGAHLLDQFVVAFGLPSKITAFVGLQRVYSQPGTGEESEGGDSFTVHFHYENFRGEGGRMMATARAGVVSAEQQQLRWWVRGTQGSYRKLELDVQEDQLKAGMRPEGFVAVGGRGYGAGRGLEGKVDEQYGLDSSELEPVVTKVMPGRTDIFAERVKPFKPPVTYKRFYQLLAQAIRGKGPNPVGAEEAARVIRLIELAIQSSQEERTVACDINW